MTPRTWKVLIADGHPILRKGLCAILEVLPEFELVGEATSGAEALGVASTTPVDVAVLDLHMPALDGVEATRQLLATRPGLAVLLLSMRDDEAMLVPAVRAGARGYLLKGAGFEEIARALRAVVSAPARPWCRPTRRGDARMRKRRSIA